MERHEGKSVRPLAIRHANAPTKNSHCKWKATAPNRGSNKETIANDNFHAEVKATKRKEFNEQSKDEALKNERA